MSREAAKESQPIAQEAAEHSQNIRKRMHVLPLNLGITSGVRTYLLNACITSGGRNYLTLCASLQDVSMTSNVRTTVEERPFRAA